MKTKTNNIEIVIDPIYINYSLGELKHIVNNFPNDSDLGAHIRHMVNSK